MSQISTINCTYVRLSVRYNLCESTGFHFRWVEWWPMWHCSVVGGAAVWAGYTQWFRECLESLNLIFLQQLKYSVSYVHPETNSFYAETSPGKFYCLQTRTLTILCITVENTVYNKVARERISNA